MIFFLLFAAYVEFFAYEYTSEFQLVLGNKINHWTPIFVLVGIAFYYFLLKHLFQFYEKKKKLFPIWGRFFTAFIETSVPTLFLCLIAQVHDSVYVLLSPRVMLYFIYIILSALTLDLRLCFFTGLVAASEYGALAFYFLNYTHPVQLDPYLLVPEHYIARSVMLFIAGCATAFVTGQIRRQLLSSFNAVRQRDQITQIFGRHVSPEVVNMLLSQKSNKKGEDRFVCVLFLDIRNFTAFAENKNPEEVVSYLNQLFSWMITIINENHGIINKFLGDGLMAVFGAPVSGHNDTDNSVKAAEQIIERINREVELATIPATRVGIGIHCGIVVTGTIGTPKRQEYTIIGDVVNLASRIEQLNKTYNSQLLISEDVYKGLHDHTQGTLLGEVMLKGRQKPINIYQLK
jgi:adenylate cyclase